MEYIARERALEILIDIVGCGVKPGSYTAGWDEAINAAYEAVQSEPAIEAAPVVNAKWYPFSGNGNLVLCSRCCDWNTYNAKFCPSCGAKMDVGVV